MERSVTNSFSYTGSVSGWLIIINVVCYLATMYYSGTSNAMHPRFAELGGAADSVLMASGEWWRVFTGIFFHFGVAHLLMNCMALKFIGQRIETIIGGKVFLFVYLCSGLISTLASSFVHTSVGGGASGAIFGLIGVGVVLEFILPIEDRMPASTRSQLPFKMRLALLARKYSYLALTIVNVFFAITVNMIFWLFSIKVTIDNTAHLVGLGSGALVFWAYVLFFKQRRAPAIGLYSIIFTAFLWGAQMFFQGSYVLDSYYKRAQTEKDPPSSYYLYSQALKIEPNNQKVLFARGKLAFDYGDFLTAVKDFERLVALGYPKEPFELLLSSLPENKVHEKAILSALLKQMEQSSATI